MAYKTKEKRRAYEKRYRAKNRRRLRLYHRQWEQAHQDRTRERKMRAYPKRKAKDPRYDYSRQYWDRSPHPPAISCPTTLDIAWAAGVFEGEGNPYCGTWRTILVQVSQKDWWLLKRLSLLFGGKRTTNGHGGGRGADVWWIVGHRAAGFLMTIYKFLSPRRKAQIRKVLRKAGFLKRGKS